MKYFGTNTDSYWGGKINFVDENDVFVGYDYSQNCCEDFGWFLSSKINDNHTSVDDHIATNDELVNTLLEGWIFDTTFFEEKQYGESNYSEEGLAIFRMTKGEHVMYLHLYNVHNGYYSHGFEFEGPGQVFKTGRL